MIAFYIAAEAHLNKHLIHLEERCVKAVKTARRHNGENGDADVPAKACLFSLDGEEDFIPGSNTIPSLLQNAGIRDNAQRIGSIDKNRSGCGPTTHTETGLLLTHPAIHQSASKYGIALNCTSCPDCSKIQSLSGIKLIVYPSGSRDAANDFFRRKALLRHIQNHPFIHEPTLSEDILRRGGVCVVELEPRAQGLKGSPLIAPEHGLALADPRWRYAPGPLQGSPADRALLERALGIEERSYFTVRGYDDTVILATGNGPDGQRYLVKASDALPRGYDLDTPHDRALFDILETPRENYDLRIGAMWLVMLKAMRAGVALDGNFYCTRPPEPKYLVDLLTHMSATGARHPRIIVPEERMAPERESTAALRQLENMKVLKVDTIQTGTSAFIRPPANAHFLDYSYEPS